jgi:hypothetical protein
MTVTESTIWKFTTLGDERVERHMRSCKGQRQTNCFLSYIGLCYTALYLRYKHSAKHVLLGTFACPSGRG